MSGPEHNPMDDIQPTREEWEAYESARAVAPTPEQLLRQNEAYLVELVDYGRTVERLRNDIANWQQWHGEWKNRAEVAEQERDEWKQKWADLTRAAQKDGLRADAAEKVLREIPNRIDYTDGWGSAQRIVDKYFTPHNSAPALIASPSTRT